MRLSVHSFGNPILLNEASVQPTPKEHKILQSGFLQNDSLVDLQIVYYQRPFEMTFSKSTRF